MNIKTIEQVKTDNPHLKGLITAVLNQLDYSKEDNTNEIDGEASTISDIINHGIGGGFHGFIYYSDTEAFYKKNRKAINQLVFDLANDLGEDAVKMVCSFGCIKDENEAQNVGRCIYEGRLNDGTTQIQNALSWFAAEEIARLFEK